MKNTSPIFIYGAGGHSKVVTDIIQCSGSTIELILDDDPFLTGKSILDIPILHSQRQLFKIIEDNYWVGIIAIGDNPTRLGKALWLEQQGIDFLTAIHPRALIVRSSSVGKGSAVMANVVINAGSTVGEHSILNTACTVDHDCTLGHGVHLCPGVNLAGGVTIGDRTMVGIGASVLPGVTIGHDVVIGGGATVTMDIPNGVTAVGVPARIIS